MKNKLKSIMKKFLLIVLGVMIPITILGLAIVIIRASTPEEVWSEDNRRVVLEEFSPDKRFKIAVYDYYGGVLGYTASQLSIAGSDEEYPISGNLLKYQGIESIKWLSNGVAEVQLEGKDDWNSKVVIDIKRIRNKKFP